MSRSLNKVMLIGNVGSDPEIRSTTGGGRVASLSLATSRSWSGANGEKQEKTEWHRLSIWNKKGGGGLADVVEKFVKKGDRLYVEGEIEYRQWQDKENQTRYSTEIRVFDMVMLGSPRGGGGGGGGGDFESGSAPSRGRSSAGSKATAGAAAKSGDAGEFEDFPAALEDSDDDLPF